MRRRKCVKRCGPPPYSQSAHSGSSADSGLRTTSSIRALGITFTINPPEVVVVWLPANLSAGRTSPTRPTSPVLIIFPAGRNYLSGAGVICGFIAFHISCWRSRCYRVDFNLEIHIHSPPECLYVSRKTFRQVS